MTSTKGESIEAQGEGGLSRSSDEPLVMSGERRGWVSSRRGLPTRWLGGASFSLRRVEAGMFQRHGWHEPYESRGSRTDLRGTGGENPPVYPTVVCPYCKSKDCEETGAASKKKPTLRYRWNSCAKNSNDLTKTIFRSSHVSLKNRICCLYLMGLNISNSQIAKALDVSERTVSDVR